jgi:diadenosine tetraphosphatase ApaH/serine/threonine PP2A family protein phosphatase
MPVYETANSIVYKPIVVYYRLAAEQIPIRGPLSLKALIVSDIHSNIEAFQSVVDDATRQGGFDEIWSLGDLIGYGPDPGAVIGLLRQHEHKAVIGNHDLASIDKLSLEAFNPYAKAANLWNGKQLTSDERDFLDKQPQVIEEGEFVMCHGSPRDPVWEYVVSINAAVASFNHFDTHRCLLGHSHIPFICRPKGENSAEFQTPQLGVPLPLNTDRMIINPGGVGQPRDGDPRASYALYDSGPETVTHYRVDYDIKTTQDKMRKYELPEFLIERLEFGR